MADTEFNVNNKSDLLGYISIHLYLFTPELLKLNATILHPSERGGGGA
jgi:hypothetical protein